MKKKDTVESTLKLDRVGDNWEENRFIQFLSQYGQVAILALLAGIVAVFLIYRIASIGKDEAEMDFWNAEKEFRIFANPSDIDADPLVGTDALTKLNAIIDKHPELHAKYDSLIAQTLILRADAGDALPFANRALGRTEAENSPYYLDYAKTTLLIAETRYDDALKSAMSLDQQMRDALKQGQAADQRKFGDALFAFNLLRIGVLQNKLGLQKEELKTWQEWKQFQQGSQFPSLAKAFQQQRSLLKEGQVSISDFIDQRISALQD